MTVKLGWGRSACNRVFATAPLPAKGQGMATGGNQGENRVNDRGWSDGVWTSADGLELHYRDYPGDAQAVPLLCLPGLTRNARDFEPVARHFSPAHRVICAELRGRGQSEYARDPATYTPATYLDDVTALMDQAGMDRVIIVGTSLGGLLAMMIAARDAAAGRSRIAGAVLNDIGPVIEADGLARIREYVGHGRSFPSWMHAARALEEQQGTAFPAFTTDEWLRFAKRVMIVGTNGRIQFDYDMKIAEPFREPDTAAPPDLWPAFDALAQNPLLIIRGALSDLLSEATLAQMQARAPDAAVLTIAQTGHAPTLDEPEALAAIKALVEKAG
jgi:pimeloyl-ACP methyl ester carboxylesterase